MVQASLPDAQWKIQDSDDVGVPAMVLPNSLWAGQVLLEGGVLWDFSGHTKDSDSVQDFMATTVTIGLSQLTSDPVHVEPTIHGLYY